MNNAQKYVPMTKKERIFRWCNIAFDLAIMLTGVALAIYYKTIGDPNNRFLASLSMLAFGLIPFAYELISRAKITNSVFLMFDIYLLVAGLLGAGLNGYNTFAWLDIVVHFIMGYMMALLGFFIICRTKQNTKMHFLMIAFFCFAFSLMVEVIWEISEWTVDNIANQTAQGLPIEGYGAPLVTDTMEDLCCNTGGALLFMLHYLTSKWSKKNLLITSMEKEFSIRHKLFEKSNKKGDKVVKNDEIIIENNGEKIENNSNEQSASSPENIEQINIDNNDEK